MKNNNKKECLNILKNIKRNLGPQINYKQFINEEEIKLTKSIHCLERSERRSEKRSKKVEDEEVKEEGKESRNIFLELLFDISKSFQKNHGTVKDSLT